MQNPIKGSGGRVFVVWRRKKANEKEKSNRTHADDSVQYY